MNIKPILRPTFRTILLASALALSPSISYADHHGTKPDICFTEDEFELLAVDFEKDTHRRYKGKTIETHRYQEVDEYVEIYQPDPQEVCIWDTNSDLFKSESTSTLPLSDGGIFDLGFEIFMAEEYCTVYKLMQIYVRVLIENLEYLYSDEIMLDIVDAGLEDLKTQYDNCKYLSEELNLPEPIYHEYLRDRDLDYKHPTLNFEETNQ